MPAMSSLLKVISTKEAPAAIGPYSQAIIANGFVYVSGQIPLKPNGELVPITADIQEQTKQCLLNLSAILSAANSSLGHVVKTTVYLKDMNDFVKMNEIYSQFFGEHRPARAAFEVARLPKDVKVEIECVAVVPPSS